MRSEKTKKQKSPKILEMTRENFRMHCEVGDASGLLFLNLFILMKMQQFTNSVILGETGLCVYSFCLFLFVCLFLLPAFLLFFFLDIVRSDVALDKQKGCKIAQHPDVMLELQREKAAQMHLVLLKEQFSNTYSNLILTGKGIGVGWNLRALQIDGLHWLAA